MYMLYIQSMLLIFGEFFFLNKRKTAKKCEKIVAYVRVIKVILKFLEFISASNRIYKYKFYWGIIFWYNFRSQSGLTWVNYPFRNHRRLLV